MVTLKEKPGLNLEVILDGKRIGYAAIVSKSDVGFVLSKRDLSDSQLGQVARAMDARDGCDLPARNLCLLDATLKSKDVTTYAD